MIENYQENVADDQEENENSISSFFLQEAQSPSAQQQSADLGGKDAISSEPGLGEGSISSALLSETGVTEDVTPEDRLNVLDAYASGLRGGILGAPVKALGGAEELPKEMFPQELRSHYMVAKTISDAVPIAVATTAATAAAVPATIGAAVTPVAAGASTALTTGRSLFSKAFRPIIQSFAKSPEKFAALEASSILGAAQARGISESLFPDNDTVGVISEMVGSVVNPIGTAYRATKGPASSIYSSFERLTPKGVKAQASEYISRVASEFGENPEDLLRQIEANKDVPLPPGQIIESKTLNAISKELSKDSELLRNTTREALTQYNEQILKDLGRVTASGDPEAVRKAAEVRKDYFGNLLNSYVESAKNKANLAVAKITRGADPAEASEVARKKSDAIQKELESVYRWGRKVQDELYPKALKELQARQPDLDDVNIDELYPSTMQTFASVNARAIPGEDVTKTFSRLYGNEVGGSLNKLLNLETPPPIEMYNLAKLADSQASVARNAKNYEKAQALQSLKNNILDDIHAIDTPLLDTARDFTAQYRQVFDRTFAATAVPRTESEIRAATSGRLMERALAPGGSRALANVQDLENAADFNVPNASPREPTGWVIKNETEGFLLANASKFIRDGEVRQAALDNFRARNPELMQEYPELNAIFQDATQTQQALKRLEKSQKLINSNVVNLNVFQRVLDANETNLDQVIGNLFEQNPEQSARRLSSMIRRFADGSENQVKAAQEGLVSAIVDQAMVKSKIGKNSVDWLKVRERVSPELLDTLRKNTLITESQSNRINQILNESTEVMRAANNPTELPLKLEKANLLSAALFRGLGAETFRRSFERIGIGQGAGPSLVIAQSGAEFMQQKAALDPLGKVKDVLIRASLDKELYADLLRRAPTIESAKQQFKSINSALYAAGITPEEDEEFYNYLFEQQQQPQEQGQQ